jgi:hypothetical protein
MKIKINSFMIIGIVILIFLAAYFVPFNNNETSSGECEKPIINEKVIFIHQPGCLACTIAEPIMKEGDDVYWLDLAVPKCRGRLEELDLASIIKVTPTFVCTKNVSIILEGIPVEETKTALNQWINENCE